MNPADPGVMSRAVLVTGATGFIGRALVTALAGTDRFEVRAAGRAGRTAASPVQWVAVGDIDGDTEWRPALSGVEIVVHLAARAHIMRDTHDAPLAEFRRVNVDGTMNLARQAEAQGVRRFVFVSSIGVNGNHTSERPFSERDPAAPAEAYAVSKLEAEQGLATLAGSGAMEVVVVRPPLVHGPGAPGNFGRLQRLVSRAPLLPLGATHNRRSLVGLDNLVDFIMTCMEHPAAANETFLVSDGEDLSTTDLIRLLSRALGRSPWLVPVPPGLLTVAATVLGRREMAERLLGSLQVDISKARQRLGWHPPLTVDEGLRRAAGHPT